MTDQQDLRERLPELPEPAHHYNRAHPNGILVSDSVPMFTAEQMHAYALEAAAQLGRVEDPDWLKVNDALMAYVEDYELYGEDEEGREGCYTPTEIERFMLTDCINGLLDDDDFKAAYGRHQLPAGVPAVELLDRIFNEEIERVSTVEFNSNSICRKFYGEVRKRLVEELAAPQPDNKESR